MSTVEPLNSEPEVISGVEENTENTCNCHCHEKATEREEDETAPLLQEVENSAIFLVSIDSRPQFYCQSYEEAVDQANDFLRSLATDLPNCAYNIEQEEDSDTIVLTSTYRWFVIQYDTVEAVASIRKIPRIQF